MLNEKIAKMLNEQITRELFSAYLYLDFANYYEDEALAGFAHWYEVQAQEERDHALLMRRYLIDSGVRVVFEAVERPKGEYKDFAQPLNEGLAHELFVTAHICAVYEPGARAQRLQDRAVSRLVCERTGRRGENRRRFDPQDESFRRRREGPVSFESGTRGARLRARGHSRAIKKERKIFSALFYHSRRFIKIIKGIVLADAPHACG